MFPDIFNNDAFSQITLTQQILSTPFQEHMLSARLPWTIENSPTPDVAIERSSEGVAVITSAPRGAPGVEFGLTKKSVIKVTPPHYPAGATIQSTELRAALNHVGDNGELLGVQALHQRHMNAFVRSYAQMWEHGAQGALEGLIKDPGIEEPVLDLGELWGEVPQVVEVDFTDPSVDWVQELTDAKTAAIQELTGMPAVTDWVFMLFGSAAKFVTSNEKLLKTKDRIDDTIHSADRVRGFSRYRFADNVELVTYQGTKNMPCLIDFGSEAGGGLLLPIVQGMYTKTFTPAESFDSINAPGQEIYASVPKSKITESSYRLQAESNCLHTIKKPKAVMKFLMPQ